MDFVVNRENFLKELQYVQGVVEKKTTVPILSNILLETTGNNLSITATDLDVTIRCGCRASIKVSGAVTVAARKLFDIVRLLPDSDIHFKQSSPDWVQLTCERSRFKIGTLGKENFPDIPQISDITLGLPSGAIRYMIPRCIFAITQEESRFALNGALLLIRPGTITMVTTDGHRLALISREVEVTGAEGESRHLVPRKTLVELSKLAGGADSPIEFGDSHNHLFFKVGDRYLISRLLSGQFPNYEMVIPTDSDKRILLSTVEFSDALRRVATMAEEQSRAIKLSLAEDQLDILASSSEYGEAKESLSIQYQGEPLTVCFNAVYLLDFLSGLESEQVVLELKDGESQGLLSPETQEDYKYQYVAMPMKL